jgi:hypothetical protein
MLKILDGSAGYGKPLTEQEIKEFLTTKILNLYLGTIDENGHANGKVETYMLRSSSNSAWVKFLISLMIMEITYE